VSHREPSVGAPIRYLDAATVAAHLPGPRELIGLAELALRSLVGGADVPPKAGLGDPDGRFAHAMPARLMAGRVPTGATEAGAQGIDAVAAGDLLGMKWIAGGPGNRAAGLPAMSALILLSDPGSGMPVAILEGGTITAWRTAALSAVAIGLLARAAVADAPRVVLLGAGAQGRAHLALLPAVLPGAAVTIHDRHPDRAAEMAAGAPAGLGPVTVVADPGAALLAADVVVSATSLGGTPDLGPGAVGPGTLLVPVDYGARVSADLAATAADIVVDDRAQYDRNRTIARLPGWPDATGTLGDRLLDRRERPAGRALAIHQGPAIADLVVAAAVLDAAARTGAGMLLPR
jgi:ornithine cyclodeaminase/alanine dehydrogenase-like protein (mu-crystallin family)